MSFPTPKLVIKRMWELYQVKTHQIEKKSCDITDICQVTVVISQFSGVFLDYTRKVKWCKRLYIDWLFEITSITSHRCSITTSFLFKTGGGAQQSQHDTTAASRQWFPSAQIWLNYCPANVITSSPRNENFNLLVWIKFLNLFLYSSK